MNVQLPLLLCAYHILVKTTNYINRLEILYPTYYRRMVTITFQLSHDLQMDIWEQLAY